VATNTLEDEDDDEDEDEMSTYRAAVPQCNDTVPQVSDPEGWNLRCLTASSAWWSS
jgi:hypothetical protein